MDGRPGPEKPDYRSRVPEFERKWQEHERRWPRDERAASDLQRPGDPRGSWRGVGDRYLSPDQNRQADRLITELRQPEPSITAQLKRIEAENPHGAKLAGLDHRLKGDQRLKEKIADKMRAKGESDPANVITTINDAVRYTFCFDGNVYVRAYGDICRRLRAAGYQMMDRESHWLSDPYYKGLNTRWETRRGDRFELQFHTPESFHAKEVTHPAYERLRAAGTSRHERRELTRFHRIVNAAIPRPMDIAQLGGLD